MDFFFDGKKLSLLLLPSKSFFIHIYIYTHLFLYIYIYFIYLDFISTFYLYINIFCIYIYISFIMYVCIYIYSLYTFHLYVFYSYILFRYKYILYIYLFIIYIYLSVKLPPIRDIGVETMFADEEKPHFTSTLAGSCLFPKAVKTQKIKRHKGKKSHYNIYINLTFSDRCEHLPKLPHRPFSYYSPKCI